MCVCPPARFVSAVRAQAKGVTMREQLATGRLWTAMQPDRNMMVSYAHFAKGVAAMICKEAARISTKMFAKLHAHLDHSRRRCCTRRAGDSQLYGWSARPRLDAMSRTVRRPQLLAAFD